MGSIQSDHNKRLIKLRLITLSGFHCSMYFIPSTTMNIKLKTNNCNFTVLEELVNVSNGCISC